MKLTVRKTTNYDAINELDNYYFYGCEPLNFDDCIAYMVTASGGINVAYLVANKLADGFYFLSRVAVVEDYRGNNLQYRLQKRLEMDLRTAGVKAISTYTMVGNVHSANNMIKTGYRMYNPAYAWVGDDVNYWKLDL